MGAVPSIGITLCKLWQTCSAGSMGPAEDPSQWRGVGFKITSGSLVQSKSFNDK